MGNSTPEQPLCSDNHTHEHPQTSSASNAAYTSPPSTPPPTATVDTPSLLDPSSATFPRLTPFLRDPSSFLPGLSDSNVSMSDFLPSPDPAAMYNALTFSSPVIRDFSSHFQNPSCDSSTDRSPSPTTAVDQEARMSAAAAEINALFNPQVPLLLSDENVLQRNSAPPNTSNMSLPELRLSSSNFLSVLGPLAPSKAMPTQMSHKPACSQTVKPSDKLNHTIQPRTSNHLMKAKQSVSQTSSYTPPPDDAFTVSPSTSPEGLDDQLKHGVKQSISENPPKSKAELKYSGSKCQPPTTISCEKSSSSKSLRLLSQAKGASAIPTRNSGTHKNINKAKRVAKRSLPALTSTAPTLALGPAPNTSDSKPLPRVRSGSNVAQVSNAVGIGAVPTGIAESMHAPKIGVTQQMSASTSAGIPGSISDNAAVFAMNQALAAGLLSYTYPFSHPFLTTPEAMAYHGRPVNFVNGANGAQMIPMDLLTQATAIHYRNAIQAAQVAYGAQHAAQVHAAQVHAAQVQAAQVHAAHVQVAQARAAHAARFVQAQASNVAHVPKCAEASQETGAVPKSKFPQAGKASYPERTENTGDRTGGLEHATVANHIPRPSGVSKRSRPGSGGRAGTSQQEDKNLAPGVDSVMDDGKSEPIVDAAMGNNKHNNNKSRMELQSDECERGSNQKLYGADGVDSDEDVDDECDSRPADETVNGLLLSGSSQKTWQLQMMERSSRLEVQARENRARAKKRLQEKKSVRGQALTVRYACRKRIAMIRPRVNGRFATKEEVEENDRKGSTST